ncbi:MAG: Hsp33 family molecular chaperone HslO [Oscillospiraceae bacterium]|nr:Hsp33 family molecular chaperone HslO [Oscillospiraceae bacterium]
MKNNLIKAIAKGGMVRISSIDGTEIVQKAAEFHKTSATASAALGRLLMATALMSQEFKDNLCKLTLKIQGDGPIGELLCVGSKEHVKGYALNPEIELEPNSKGKLDVSGAVGKGYLYVIKDLKLKEPYVGQVPLYTGEIAEDIAYYYTISEQINSAVGLGVLVDKDLSIKKAGGFIIQMLPDADPLLSDFITYRLEEIPSITKMMEDGKEMRDILEFIFEGMDFEILEESYVDYYCDCSREKVEKALISIGKKELLEIAKDNKDEELVCHFCNKKYIFTPGDIQKLI